MAGKLEIDTGKYLGTPDPEHWSIISCNAHEGDGIYSVMYMSNDHCPLCEYIESKGKKTKELEEKIELSDKFQRLAELERDAIRDKYNKLEAEVADYIAQKRAIEEAVKKAL